MEEILGFLMIAQPTGIVRRIYSSLGLLLGGKAAAGLLSLLVGGARVRALIMAGARMQIALRICGAAYPYTCRRVGAL